MARRNWVFFGGHGHAYFNPAQTASIAHIDLAQLALGGWFGQRSGHASQQAHADAPHKEEYEDGSEKPDDSGKVDSQHCNERHQESAKAFDDGGVGHAAAFAHGLETITTASALKFVKQRGHQSCT